MSDEHIQRPCLFRKIVLISICLGLITWLVKALVDTLVEGEGDFLYALFPASPSELRMRFFITLVVTGVSVYAGFLISRLKRSDKKLALSEKRYRSLIETAPDVIFTLSADGIFTSFNPAFEIITDWQREEILGKRFSFLVHPDDTTFAESLFMRLLAGRTPPSYELRIRSRSGEYLTVEVNSVPQIEDGSVVSILGVGRDITERKKAEQALRDSEARYRDIFENANDLIQSVAADGKFLYVNRAWLETLGYTQDEVAGLTFLDIIHPDFKQHCMDVFSLLIAGEKINDVEVVFVAKSGRSVIVEGNVTGSRLDGKLVATRGIFRDITDHRHASEFIKNILESVDEGFIVVNRDYRIISANKAFARKAGLPLHDIIGKYCYEVSHRLERPCYEVGEDCSVRHAFQTGGPHTALHVHNDHEGNPVSIETKAFPLKDALGRVVSAIEILNDVTEKRKLEGQLRHAQKMEAVGTLAGGVAHDFNNILTAIIGYGSLLQMKLREDDPLRSYADQIIASTERAANLTQGLLAFSRKQAVAMQPVALNPLVRRVEKLIARLIGEDIETRIALCGEPLSIKADFGQIEQVLMNLVTNARDAMPRGGVLTIETSVAAIDSEFIRAHGYGTVGRYALLAVTDTGIGMDEKTRERIFEPFFTTKEVGKGTGLGLSIVYGMVKQHDGFINVYSEPGKGTTFKLYLPLIAAAIEPVKTAEAGIPESGTATILVAEDDSNVRGLTCAVLEGFGYTVIEAVDGQDALAKFSDNKDRIQLLLLDVIMPKKNGRTVYEEIRTIRPDVKVLFTSGYTAEVMRHKGIFDDPVNFLSKPVTPRDLLRKVKEVLDSKPK